VNPDTGKLYKPEQFEKLPQTEQEKCVELTESEYDAMRKVNRHERRAALAKMRREAKKR